MIEVYVGIDPGVTGGISTIINGHAEVYPMPVIGRVVDGRHLRLMLCDFDPLKTLIAIEEQYYVPGQRGVKTNLVNFGKLQGVCDGLPLSYIVINAKEWKSVVLKGLPWQKTNSDHKEVSVQYVKQKYLYINLKCTEKCTKDSHDLADAVCIAEYALLRGGEETL